MNKKLILAGFLFLFLFVSGCDNQEKITGNVVKEIIEDDFFCKPPYIEYQKETCCLDSDNNGVCDDDDFKFKKAEPKEEPKQIEIAEDCPYTCPENRVCKPVYREEKIIRWACA